MGKKRNKLDETKMVCDMISTFYLLKVLCIQLFVNVFADKNSKTFFFLLLNLWMINNRPKTFIYLMKVTS